MANIRARTALMVALLGVAPLAGAAPTGGDPLLHTQLASIAERRIYFGHQSVGYDIMQGLSELSAESGVPLRIVEVSDSLGGAPAGFLHGRVDENGNPLRKLESFRRTLSSAPAPGMDIAVLKFCYVDLGERTDVAALFRRYQGTIAELRASSPGTTFVHVTVPLTTVQGGVGGYAKKLLGRKPDGVSDNLRREEYNDLLRRAYAGREPVLDVALVESTTPEGRRFTAEWEGKAVPAMVPSYTKDGGHLGPEGRRRVARELVAVLASVQRPAPGGTASR